LPMFFSEPDPGKLLVALHIAIDRFHHHHQRVSLQRFVF